MDTATKQGNETASSAVNRRMLKSILQKKDIHLNEILTGSSFAFGLNILGHLCGYVFILLITRNLGADAMGIFSLSYTVLVIFVVIGNLGFDTALLRFVADYSSTNRWDLVKEVYLKALRLIIPFSFLLTILLFYCSPYIAKYIFNKDHLSIYIKLISFGVLPLVLLGINAECLRGVKKIKESVFFSKVSVVLVGTIIFSILIFYVKEYYLPIVIYVICIVLMSILCWIVWMKKSRLSFSSYNDSLEYKTILSVSVPMLLSKSSLLLMAWTDTIILGIFRTEGEVGIYNVAFRVAILTSFTLPVIFSITAPKFASLYGIGETKELKRVFRISTKMVFWTSIPVLLTIFLFPSFILGMFGSAFKEGVFALLILSFGYFIASIFGSAGHLLQMTGKQKIYLNIILIATIINIILNLVLVPVYGINGAALSTMVSMAFAHLLMVIFVYKIFGFTTIYFLPGGK